MGEEEGGVFLVSSAVGVSAFSFVDEGQDGCWNVAIIFRHGYVRLR